MHRIHRWLESLLSFQALRRRDSFDWNCVCVEVRGSNVLELSGMHEIIVYGSCQKNASAKMQINGYLMPFIPSHRSSWTDRADRYTRPLIQTRQTWTQSRNKSICVHENWLWLWPSSRWSNQANRQSIEALLTTLIDWKELKLYGNNQWFSATMTLRLGGRTKWRMVVCTDTSMG